MEASYSQPPGQQKTQFYDELAANSANAAAPEQPSLNDSLI